MKDKIINTHKFKENSEIIAWNLPYQIKTGCKWVIKDLFSKMTSHLLKTKACIKFV